MEAMEVSVELEVHREVLQTVLQLPVVPVRLVELVARFL
jgi:hypothetical protein